MNWRPHIPQLPADYEPWPAKRLIITTLIALAVVAAVTLTVIIPAEDGADPFGAGRLLGLDAFHVEPAPEAPAPVAQNVTELFTFPYNWTTSTALWTTQTGNLAEGGSTTVDVTVDVRQVLAVTAVLSWQDEAVAGDPAPDTFTLRMDGPPGNNETTGSNDGESGQLTLDVQATMMPAAGNVTAQSQADARAMIEAAHGRGENGTGAWTISISLDDVADLIGDEGNDWSLQVFVETFALVLGDASGRPSIEATIPLSLPALGDWLEYKVYLDEGASLDYEWTATGEVRYDLHGKRSTGEESSHARGFSTGESGTLRVPFSGQHGWAMRNYGAVDVEVTITIRGPFVLPAS